MTGKTISHHRIQDMPGGGGMGVLYKAEDGTLKPTVALKFLPEEVSKDHHSLENSRLGDSDLEKARDEYAKFQ